MNTPDFDIMKERRLLGKDTEQYLSYLKNRGIFNPEKVHCLLNLACGAAKEGVVLEDIFPDAQIYAVEKDQEMFQIAYLQKEETPHTHFIHGNLYETELWQDLPRADLVLFQHPQIGGEMYRVNIIPWLKYAHDKLTEDGTIILCIKVASEMEEFATIRPTIQRFFEEILVEKNPHGRYSDFSHLIVLKKKGGERNFIERKLRHQERFEKIMRIRNKKGKA